MSKKTIKMNSRKKKTFSQVWGEFITSQTAKGVSEATIGNYHRVLHNISKYFDIDVPMNCLSKRMIEEMVVEMREAGLAHNTVATYVRVVRTFLNWCKAENIVRIEISNIKEKETVKDTYSDEELGLLLRRPSADCSFCEYRSWVIINFLLNCGCRASTVRNIQNRDVNLVDNQVVFRHTKNGKIQVIPLCSRMVNVLRGYMAVRGGVAEDYLFCDQYGGSLTLSQYAVNNFKNIFSDKDSNWINKVTLNDKVTSISSRALYGISSLKSVTVPQSVTDIGNKAFGYYIDNDSGLTVRIKDLTVYGYKGTAAEKYANDNRFTFIALDDQPTEPPTEPPTQASFDPTKTTKRDIFGDIDGDRDITIVDTTFLQRYTVSLQTPYPIGERIK